MSIILVLGLAWRIVGMSDDSSRVPESRSETAAPNQQGDTTSSSGSTTQQTTTATPKASAQQGTVADTTKYYTAAEVALHTSTQSCWSIVNGKVYDLTSWISRHPGGSGAIKQMCGIDGSAGFNGQHGGQGRPEQELASFYIGVLKK